MNSTSIISLFFFTFIHFNIHSAELPSVSQFQVALSTCATNANISIDADLIGSISDIYDGDRVNGAASFKTSTTFLTLFPEEARADVYKIYTKCIVDILYPVEAKPKNTSNIRYFPEWGAENNFWPKYKHEEQTFKEKVDRVFMRCADCVKHEAKLVGDELSLANAIGSYIILDAKDCNIDIRVALRAFKLYPSDSAPPRLEPVYDSFDLLSGQTVRIRADSVSNFQVAPVQCLD